MARALFDPHFLQALQHRRDLGLKIPSQRVGRTIFGRRNLPRNSKPRLQSVCDLLRRLELEPTFPETELPSASEMDEIDVIVTGSRLKAFTEDELLALVRFAETGGGILIMSNHGAPIDAPNDFTRYDRALVAKFDIDLECTAFSDAARSRAVPVSVEHPITRGIRELSINNCSSLVSAERPSVIDIPTGWRDPLAGMDPHGRAIAIAINQGIEGRVLVLSDSGFMGDEGTRSPGPGLIHEADNRNFLTNVFSWLAKIER